jgi:hypothetical protein
MSSTRFDLAQDRKGMMWDLLLYIPTVVALSSVAIQFWYSDNANLAYLLAFMASFFCIVGANRVLKTRLMILPTAPVAIEIDKALTRLVLRNGKHVELVKELKFYSEISGRTFGLSGLDGSGQRLQFVFHKGQFPSAQDFQTVQDKLRKCC